MRIFRSALFVITLAACATPAAAAPILIDFESLNEFDDVTTQFDADGIVFSGAQVLVAGSSLNEFDFPPVSGFQAALDGAGGMRVDFATGALAVSGYFTYAAPVTMTAFSGATVLGSVTSGFESNYVSSGNPNNELLQLAFAQAITHVTVVGSEFGGSFTLDDFFVETRDELPPPPIPEPATVTLLLAGAALLGGRRMRTGGARSSGA